MIEIFSKKLHATGDSSMPQGYRHQDDSTLHVETTTSAGKVLTKKYYKTWDSGTETLSNLAVEVTYSYTGQKLVSEVVNFYFVDDTLAFTDTLEYKTDSVDSNKTLITKSRT